MDLLLVLDRTAFTPLWRQIYAQIRERILAGELRATERLPSSRALARALQVSRNSILDAYDQLVAEGYLESRPQSGMVVARGLQLAAVPAAQPAVPAPRAPSVPRRDLIDFRPGLPSLDHIPRRRWGALLQAVCRDAPSSVWGYGSPEGHAEVRASLSHYLARTRGVRCHPDQMVMTSGAAQAFALIAQLCLEWGDQVLTEDPMAADIRLGYTRAGAVCVPIPVDAHGLETEHIPTHVRPRLIHVTPSHQFPLGGVLPIGRRLELLRLARERESLIIEDDYDSEIRHQGAPIPALQGFDPERVIYIGTLSKILAPALRLGYAIVPWTLVEQARQIKQHTDLHAPTIEQLALARFIDEGYLDRHVATVKKEYRRRRDALLAALQRHFEDRVRIWGATTGMHLVAEWPARSFSEAQVVRWAEGGVQVYPVERHALLAGQHGSKLIFGYGHLSPAQITLGVARLAQVGGAELAVA
jgi:GntR family transcriptional regulator/MocR family aminotransferase